MERVTKAERRKRSKLDMELHCNNHRLRQLMMKPEGRSIGGYMTDEIKHEFGSGNVFEDLGLPNAEVENAKVQEAIEIFKQGKCFLRGSRYGS